jgi:hypothetical protein
MPEKFVVTIPVKPYVKRFVELNYGLPADFTAHPAIHKELRRCLRKPDTQYDRKLENRMSTYSATIDLLISQDDFYRYGWEFSRTDVVMFGKNFECLIKSQMHATVTIYRGIGLTTKDSILNFQKHFSMEEEYWPFDSIKKEYYRKKAVAEIDFFPEIINKINHLFLMALSPKKDNARNKKAKHEAAE